MNKKKEIIVRIDKCVNSGNGLGFINGKVVFVPYALPGEIVEVDIDIEKKDYYTAKINKYIKQNKNKIEHECKYFFECNGCCFQHISYEEELKLKQYIIEEVINKKKLKVESLKKIIASDKRYNYRRKITINFKEDKKGKKAGYFIEKTHEIYRIKNCLLASFKIFESLERVIECLYNFPFYNEENLKEEALKKIIVSEYENGLGIIIEHSFKKIPEKILKLLIENNFISIAENSSENSVNIIYGKKKIKIGNSFEKSPESFMQVNASIEIKIKNYIKDKIPNNKYLFDLYCGIGIFSLTLSNRFKKVIGIDSFPRAVMDAVYNAFLLDIKNTIFYNLNDREISGKLLKMDSTVIIDPPRTGINKSLLKKLIKKRVSNIFYISCDLSTMVRDLKNFTDNKYRILEIQPFDMFPLTTHIECVAFLTI